MPRDIKLIEAKISEISQSGASFGYSLGNVAKKALTNIDIPLARENLPGLVSNLNSNAIKKFERKISRRGVVRARKGFTLSISNEDTNDIIKIIKPLEDLVGVFIDGVTETVKNEIKKQEDRFLGVLLAPLAVSLVQPVISSVVKDISRSGVRRSGKRYINTNF